MPRTGNGSGQTVAGASTATRPGQARNFPARIEASGPPKPGLARPLELPETRPGRSRVPAAPFRACLALAALDRVVMEDGNAVLIVCPLVMGLNHLGLSGF
jgi:hypothetical protein